MPRRDGILGGRVLGVCAGCAEAVIWALTEKGRRMPVSPQQDIAGNLVLCYEVDQHDRPVSGQLVVVAPAGYEGPRWRTHFATCPKASTFRRREAERGDL